MLKIAVCDDDQAHLEKIRALLERWLRKRGPDQGQIAAFASGEALLESIRGKGGFDLYILDVIMPGLNGIETGKKLRELGEGGEILYLTTSRDYAVDSYLTRAFFYLLKPVEAERLFPVLDEAVERLESRRERGVMVPLSRGSRLVLLERILYVERVGRIVRYHCTDGEVDSRSIHASFRETVAPLLEDRRFYLCGASYTFNLQRVVGVSSGQALLDGGGAVALPQRWVTPFKVAWGDYWLGEG